MDLKKGRFEMARLMLRVLFESSKICFNPIGASPRLPGSCPSSAYLCCLSSRVPLGGEVQCQCRATKQKREAKAAEKRAIAPWRSRCSECEEMFKSAQVRDNRTQSHEGPSQWSWFLVLTPVPSRTKSLEFIPTCYIQVASDFSQTRWNTKQHGTIDAWSWV